MKRPALYSLSVFLAAALWFPSYSLARPMDFKEVSLFLRAGENEGSIRDEVTQRKLMRPLTTQQENILRTEGASDTLLQTLRSSNLVASKEQVAASEAQDRQAAVRAQEDAAVTRNAPQVHVFNVAFGHPINLSEWGGADYEFAFYSYRMAGEDHIEPVMIDNVRTGTWVSRTLPLLNEGDAFAQNWYPTNEVRNWRFTPYNAHGDLKDNRFNFSDSVAVSSSSFSRPMSIDWDSPVFIEGQPYTFYRVYGAGGVSLYYIGRASDRSATVAVVSQRGF